MASIKLIKRRMKSVRNIAQITKAMEMVAASKMKKAQEQAVLGKPYAEKISQVVADLTGTIERKYHPLLMEGNPDGRILVVVVSTNKGLCGGLNTNLFRLIQATWGIDGSVDYISVGKKGEQYVAKMGKRLIADFSRHIPFEESVPAIASLLVDAFIRGTYRRVSIAYSEFVNALKHVPICKQLLPLTGIRDTEGSMKHYAEFTMEPSPNVVFAALLPHYLENQIRTAIYEAEASEHSARMIAMKNATDAAVDFEHFLTLQYNKARQEKITYEIADLVTARIAVEAS